MRVVPVGDDAVLLEVGSTAEASALYAAVRSAGLPVRDVVPGARTVLLDGLGDRERLTRFLDSLATRSWLGDRPAAGSGGVPVEVPVEVPVRYDGADLDDVARRWGMTRAEAVATHTGTTFEVAFCGFLPGFAYCTGLPDRLAVPRLDRPRPRVPAGSVGVAGEFTGVYPRASPGGWRLLGTTDLTLWDATREDPALLSPGTAVRFVEVGP